jgi:hypothetical protein
MSFFSDVYFIGGTNTPVKTKFQKLLLEVKDEIIEDKDELLELENGFILVSMAKAIKLINITWNIPHKGDSEGDGDTSSYVDVAVIRYEHDNYYLLVKQYINIMNSITKIKASICCGILSFKFSRVKSSVCNEEVLSSSAEFCIKQDIVEGFQGDIFFKTVYIFFFSAVYLTN